MLSGKIIAVQNENRTKPVMQDFHYFFTTFTQVGTTEIMTHSTFADTSRPTQLLETYHDKHNF
jgi:hypothetical protein